MNEDGNEPSNVLENTESLKWEVKNPVAKKMIKMRITTVIIKLKMIVDSGKEVNGIWKFMTHFLISQEVSQAQ